MPLLLKHDPGPCPVDDCPHTTCVNPETPVAATLLSARDGVSPTSRSFTTATYTRTRFVQAVQATQETR